MRFADAYLEKLSLDPLTGEKDPDPSTSLIVTIPACNEPGLIQTLECLLRCKPTRGRTEVIIALNSGESASEDQIRQNLISEKEIEALVNLPERHLDFLFMNRAGIPSRAAGAGFARKLAMDQAINRFNRIGREDGIILSLDADTVCEPDYLTEVERHFQQNPSARACSIYFEHPDEGTGFPGPVLEGIVQYELHLRYYVEGLRWAGHPHAYHTVGSAFAVRAGTYVKQGGMNKRTAGEDFYFLQKIIPLGGYSDLTTTCLSPSPRPSSRVAFGTGPVISRFASGEIRELESYDHRSFRDLREFLQVIPRLHSSDDRMAREIISMLPDSIRTDLGEEIFRRIVEIRDNSAGEASFIKRFFRWYNMFRTLKYINLAHRDFYAKKPVVHAVHDFLNVAVPELEQGPDGRPLLNILRRRQRNGSWTD